METSTTIRLIEASLRREDVADRANFRYCYVYSGHGILFKMLQTKLGVWGTALEWSSRT